MAKPAKRIQKSKPRKAAATAKPQRHAAAITKDTKKSKTTSPTPEKAPKAGGKLAGVLDLMRRKEGASITDLRKATGWQPHSVRAALTGFRKQGVEITRSKNGDGATIYTATQA